MAEALAGIDAQRSFEIVILSDSTNADAWIRETLTVDRLRASLLPVMPVWYRRRWKDVYKRQVRNRSTPFHTAARLTSSSLASRSPECSAPSPSSPSSNG